MSSIEYNRPSEELSEAPESPVNQALDEVAALLDLDPAVFESLKRDQSSMSLGDMLHLGRVVQKHLKEKQTDSKIE